MLMKTLDELLGRSTIEPALAEAINQGRLKEVLDDYDFPIEIRRRLERLQTHSFVEFAEQAYRLIRDFEQNQVAPQAPSATEGLASAAVRQERHIQPA